MTAAVQAAPARRPWRGLAVATAAFLLIPVVPVLRVVFPIEQTLLLVIPAIAGCALAGWRNGGRAGVGVVWTALAVWILTQHAGPAGSSYDYMARGWALLLAASFGVSAIVAAGVPFLTRALATVAVSLGFGILLASASAGGVRTVSDVVASEFGRRNAESIASLRQVSETPQWKSMTGRAPGLKALADESESQLRSIPRYSAILVPALLALESMAALAIAWSIYHATGGLPVGPALGKLRDFRFNDQLVWGLAVGATIFLLPPFFEGKNAGLNLLIFFGALYLLRGMGVLAWMTHGRILILLLFLLALFAWPLFAAVALGLGLGDTWLDWRSRAKPG